MVMELTEKEYLDINSDYMENKITVDNNIYNFKRMLLSDDASSNSMASIAARTKSRLDIDLPEEVYKPINLIESFENFEFNLYDTSLFFQEYNIPVEDNNKLIFQIEQLSLAVFKHYIPNGKIVHTEDNILFYLNENEVKSIVSLNNKLKDYGELTPQFKNTIGKLFVNYQECILGYADRLPRYSHTVSYANIFNDYEEGKEEYLFAELINWKDNQRVVSRKRDSETDKDVSSRLITLYEYFNRFFHVIRAINAILYIYEISERIFAEKVIELSEEEKDIYLKENLLALTCNVLYTNQLEIKEPSVNNKKIMVPTSKSSSIAAEKQNVYLYKNEEKMFIGLPYYHEESSKHGDLVDVCSYFSHSNNGHRIRTSMGLLIDVEAFVPENPNQYLDKYEMFNEYIENYNELIENGLFENNIMLEPSMYSVLNDKYKEYGEEGNLSSYYGEIDDGRMVSVDYSKLNGELVKDAYVIERGRPSRVVNLEKKKVERLDIEGIIERVLDKRVNEKHLSDVLNHLLPVSQLIHDKILEKTLDDYNKDNSEFAYIIHNKLYIIENNLVIAIVPIGDRYMRNDDEKRVYISRRVPLILNHYFDENKALIVFSDILENKDFTIVKVKKAY